MSEFEKYGVSENDTVVNDVKTAQFTEKRWCPWCGKLLISCEFTNVLICPEHGTLPFECPSSEK